MNSLVFLPFPFFTTVIISSRCVFILPFQRTLVLFLNFINDVRARRGLVAGILELNNQKLHAAFLLNFLYFIANHLRLVNRSARSPFLFVFLA